MAACCLVLLAGSILPAERRLHLGENHKNTVEIMNRCLPPLIVFMVGLLAVSPPHASLLEPTKPNLVVTFVDESRTRLTASFLPANVDQPNMAAIRTDCSITTSII